MKLNVKVMAKSFGVLGAIYFAVCYFVAVMFPELYKSVARSWMHMIRLEGLWNVRPDNFLFGFISFTLVSGISGYLFAVVHNYFISKK